MVKNSSTNQFDPTWQSWQYDFYQSSDPAPGALHHVYRVRSDGVTLDTVATYAYDAHGRMTQHTTATGASTDSTYDTAGNLATVTGPANNALGTRPVTTYAHDALGRVLTVTLPPPTPSSPRAFTTTAGGVVGDW